MFEGNLQHDCHELLRCLLSYVQEAVTRLNEQRRRKCTELRALLPLLAAHKTNPKEMQKVTPSIAKPADYGIKAEACDIRAEADDVKGGEDGLSLDAQGCRVKAETKDAAVGSCDVRLGDGQHLSYGIVSTEPHNVMAAIDQSCDVMSMDRSHDVKVEELHACSTKAKVPCIKSEALVDPVEDGLLPTHELKTASPHPAPVEEELTDTHQAQKSAAARRPRKRKRSSGSAPQRNSRRSSSLGSGISEVEHKENSPIESTGKDVTEKVAEKPAKRRVGSPIQQNLILKYVSPQNCEIPDLDKEQDGMLGKEGTAADSETVPAIPMQASPLEKQGSSNKLSLPARRSVSASTASTKSTSPSTRRQSPRSSGGQVELGRAQGEGQQVTSGLSPQQAQPSILDMLSAPKTGRKRYGTTRNTVQVTTTTSEPAVSKPSTEPQPEPPTAPLTSVQPFKRAARKQTARKTFTRAAYTGLPSPVQDQQLKSKAIALAKNAVVKVQRCSLGSDGKAVSLSSVQRLMRSVPDFVKLMFEGVMALRTVCCECERFTQREEEYQDISVPVKKPDRNDSDGEDDDDQLGGFCPQRTFPDTYHRI